MEKSSRKMAEIAALRAEWPEIPGEILDTYQYLSRLLRDIQASVPYTSGSTTYGQPQIHDTIRIQRQMKLMEEYMMKYRMCHSPKIFLDTDEFDFSRFNQKPEEPSGITEEDIMGVRKLDL